MQIAAHIFALIFSCLYKAAPIAVASKAGGHECLFPAVPLPHQNTSLSSMSITDVDVLWQVARLINYHFPAQKIHPMLTPFSSPQVAWAAQRGVACEPRALRGLWSRNGDHNGPPAVPASRVRFWRDAAGR